MNESITWQKIKKTKASNIYRKFRTIFRKAYNRTLSDEKLLNKMFLKKFGRKISKENPQTFNEKLQWLKLYWRDPKAEICADKYLVREYVGEKGLGHLLNDLIGVYDNVDEIDLDQLPEQFVLKCTHGSGCNIICKDKNLLNWYDAKKKLSSWMKINYYWPSREWVYKDLKPKIICEKYLEDNNNGELIDYKFYCFQGETEFIMVGVNRLSKEGLNKNFYDTDWNLMKFTRDAPVSTKAIKKPKNFNKMLENAKILSAGFPFVRVDFYEANEKLYFGELTFFPSGGFEKFQPEEYDYKFGEKLNLVNIDDRKRR